MWYVIPLTAIPKHLSKRLPLMREQYALEPYNSPEIFKACRGKGLRVKPTEVPEGHTLKFFASDDNISEAITKRNRMTDGVTYEYPPWRDPQLPHNDAPRWRSWDVMRYCYHPLLVKATGMINFFPSYAHMIEDRPEEVTIGRFLQTMWADADAGWDGYFTHTYGALTDEMLKVWTTIPKNLTLEDVKFGMTPDEIEDVYKRGPNSCMSHQTHDYSTNGIHPVRLYGAGDLAVAYLPKRRGDGFSQRAMCWPEKKVYSRIYGTGPLEDFLIALGYKKGFFDGARLLKQFVPGDDNRIVLPYVDWHDFIVERRDHLKIWHKPKQPHPFAPTAEIHVSPRTQRSWWSGQGGGTAAVAYVRAKCARCKKPMPMGTEHGSRCRKCQKSMVNCYRCGAIHDRTDPRWIRFVNTYALQTYGTDYTKLCANACVTLCERCHVSADRYRPADGYHRLIPPSINSQPNALTPEGEART